MSRSTDAVDAGLWLLAAALLLVLPPVGWVSPDGLGQAEHLADGTWRLNPNHLLNEPASAAWLEVTGPRALVALPVDRLRRLSGIWGAAAIGLFRVLLAPRLARSRAGANYGTAWLAGCAVFGIQALAAETYIVQLPAVITAGALLLRLLERPSSKVAVALGAALGLATLCFVSASFLVLAAIALCAARAQRARPTSIAASVAGVLGGFLVVVLPVFWIGWRMSGADAGLTTWVTTYGGSGLARLRGAYGIHAPAAVAGAALRSLYGAAKSIVDLVPATAQWRDEGKRIWPAARVAVAVLATWAVAGGCLLQSAAPERRRLWSILGFLVPATLVFGFFWNNSDEQFYAPLAVAIGALAAQGGLRSRRALAAGALALFWNAADLTQRFVLYPRADRLAQIADLTAGADLVLYPGFDELQVLLRLAPPQARVLSLTQVATAQPPASGLPRLREEAGAVIARGGRVVLLNVYDRPPYVAPWKFLRSLDYDSATVREALAGLPFTGPARRSGPWTVREAIAAGLEPSP